MGTTTEELKKLYAKLGGTDPNIPKASTPGEVLNGINELELGGDKLPEVTEADNGKALGVKQGQWDKMDVDIELPDVTSEDAGKVLMVNDEGNWAKDDLPSGDAVVIYPLETFGAGWKLANNKHVSDILNDIRNGKMVCLEQGNKYAYLSEKNANNIFFTYYEKQKYGDIDQLYVVTYKTNNSPNEWTFSSTAMVIRGLLHASSLDNGKILSVVNGVWEKTDPKTWSTTEHIVGKWIDGTTNVYERSYHVEDLTGAPADWESMFEVNVAEIVHTEGSAHKSNGEVISIENTGFCVCANPQVHPGYMCYHFTDATVTSFTVTVQYTKAS